MKQCFFVDQNCVLEPKWINCANCPVGAMTKSMLWEIHLIPERNAEAEISAEELEGIPLWMNGEVFGYYRKVHKLHIFIAEVELTKPPKPAWLAQHAHDGKPNIMWIKWPLHETLVQQRKLWEGN